MEKHGVNTYGMRLSNFSFVVTKLYLYDKLIAMYSGKNSGYRVPGYGCKFKSNDNFFNSGKRTKDKESESGNAHGTKGNC